MTNIAVGIFIISFEPPKKRKISGRFEIENGIKNSTSPLKIINIDKVCKNGLIFIFAIQTPLNKPIHAPTNSVAIIEKNGGIPGNHFVAINIPTPGAKASVDSMDKSKCPLIRAKLSANTSTPKKEE